MLYHESGRQYVITADSCATLTKYRLTLSPDNQAQLTRQGQSLTIRQVRGRSTVDFVGLFSLPGACLKKYAAVLLNHTSLAIIDMQRFRLLKFINLTERLQEAGANLIQLAITSTAIIDQPDRAGQALLIVLNRQELYTLQLSFAGFTIARLPVSLTSPGKAKYSMTSVI